MHCAFAYRYLPDVILTSAWTARSTPLFLLPYCTAAAAVGHYRGRFTHIYCGPLLPLVFNDSAAWRCCVLGLPLPTPGWTWTHPQARVFVTQNIDRTALPTPVRCRQHRGRGRYACGRVFRYPSCSQPGSFVLPAFATTTALRFWYTHPDRRPWTLTTFPVAVGQSVPGSPRKFGLWLHCSAGPDTTRLAVTTHALAISPAHYAALLPLHAAQT